MVHRYGRAATREELDRGEPDARSAAGDEGGLAGEISGDHGEFLPDRAARLESISQCDAVLARIRAADQHAPLPVDLDDLAAADRLRQPFAEVSARPEIGGNTLPNVG